ncbi:hypothetical protein GCM10010911_39350 [Paenibacillus nasutitermitis]|uniref:Uncharacterized protein n=1 Tax=Paenibacillus nasutitermitis TaxID=1652958 RepID=A0A917DW91_9BACL|nr:hypothetical protein GCM10010911_39350 [Paenibacillus nasutitermitis]
MRPLAALSVAAMHSCIINVMPSGGKKNQPNKQKNKASLPREGPAAGWLCYLTVEKPWTLVLFLPSDLD